MRAASLTWNGDVPGGARWPNPIKPGDTIGIFAPAHCFDRGEAERGAAVLRSWGFSVKIPQGILKKHKYLAGTDRDRAMVFEELMADETVAALMAVRGGFGCQRLLPLLADHWHKYPAKAIIGFSDLTALHLARFKATGIIGFHAPMLVSLGKEPPDRELDKKSQNDLKKLLKTGANGGGQWNFAKKDVPRPGHARGPILGGNLTLLTALLSGPWLPDMKGAILMLEEIDEPGYKLDRLFTTLRHSPVWKEAGGLVLGEFTGCGNARSLLLELAEDFDGPVVMNAPFGHAGRNRAFPVGALGALTAGS